MKKLFFYSILLVVIFNTKLVGQAASDNCSTATPITTTGLYSGTTSGYTADSPNWLNGSAVFGGSTIENSGYYKFVAASTTISFTICGNCSTWGIGGIQALIFTGTCGNLSSITKIFYMKQLCTDCGSVTASCGTGISGCPGTKPTPSCYKVNLGGLTIGQTYYFMIDGFEGSNCSYTVQFGPGSVLPVELSSFNTECINGKAVITWSTQSEINNDYFTLEKATDGINFTPVATVKGHGNSSIINNYLVTDNEAQGIAYYRLQQTDYNGEFNYYPMKSLNCKASVDFNIFPNPANHNMTLQMDQKLSTQFAVLIFNGLGEMVYTNTFKPDIDNYTINLPEHLADGIYLIQVISNSTVITKKVYLKK